MLGLRALVGRQPQPHTKPPTPEKAGRSFFDQAAAPEQAASAAVLDGVEFTGDFGLSQPAQWSPVRRRWRSSSKEQAGSPKMVLSDIDSRRRDRRSFSLPSELIVPHLPPPKPALRITGRWSNAAPATNFLAENEGQSNSAPALRRNGRQVLAGISGGCSGSIMCTTATSVHGGTYFGGAAPSFGGPRASKDGPLQGAEARAAAAAGAAKPVTFTGVASLEELRRSHKQRRSSLAQKEAYQARRQSASRAKTLHAAESSVKSCTSEGNTRRQRSRRVSPLRNDFGSSDSDDSFTFG